MGLKHWYVAGLGGLCGRLADMHCASLSRTKHTPTPSSFPGVALPPKARVSEPAEQVPERHHGLGEQLCNDPEGKCVCTVTGEVYTRPVGRPHQVPKELPAAWGTFAGIRCLLASHWATSVSVCSPASGPLHIVSPPKLLSPSFPLIDFCYLSLKSQHASQPLGPSRRGRCLHYRLSRRLRPAVCSAHSAWAPCECKLCAG